VCDVLTFQHGFAFAPRFALGLLFELGVTLVDRFLN
jgi:hypothetical protein